MNIKLDAGRGSRNYIKLGTILIPLVLLISILPIGSTAQHPSGDGMSDYAKNISVDSHYFNIVQADQNDFFIEEWIWFKNEGSENFTGNIYVWSQPPSVLKKINKFGIITGQLFQSKYIYPSSESPNFYVFNLTEYEITIGPNELLQVIYNYTITYSSLEQFQFGRTFLYNNSYIIVEISLIDRFQIEGEIDSIGTLQIDPVPDTKNSYITKHADILSSEQGDVVSLIFTKKAQEDEDSNPWEFGGTNFMIVTIIVIIAILLIIIIMIRHLNRQEQALSSEQDKGAVKHQLKSRAVRKPRKAVTVHSPRKRAAPKKKVTDPEVSRKKLNKEISKILKITARLKKDYKADLISKEMYDKLREDYKHKLKNLRKEKARFDKLTETQATPESPELNELFKKKEAILKAINKLEEDKESGIITKELYNDMMPVYKRQAVEILEKIDKFEERKT